MKNVELVALGLITPEKLTVWLPVGALKLLELFNLNLPAVVVSTSQPEASPILVGCETKADELAIGDSFKYFF